MVLTGFAWFASILQDAHEPVLFTIGEVVQVVYLAGFLYLILVVSVRTAARRVRPGAACSGDWSSSPLCGRACCLPTRRR